MPNIEEEIFGAPDGLNPLSMVINDVKMNPSSTYLVENGGWITAKYWLMYDEIPASAFTGINELLEVKIPPYITKIGSSAFSGCTNLSSVTIPNNSKLISIEENAFLGCSNITDINLPNKLKNIGRNAFMGCINLSGLTIPTTVESIGSYALEETSWYDGLSDGPIYINKMLYKYKVDVVSSVTSCQVQNGTEVVNDNAFYNFRELSSVTLPNSVKRIGNNAFATCPKLTELAIPDNVVYIGGSAFNGSSGITSLSIPDGVEIIQSHTFNGCKNLTNLTLGQGINYIGLRCFENCSKLATIVLRATVPPTLHNSSIFSNLPGGYKIYVPEESLDTYKAHQDTTLGHGSWSSIASHLYAIE